MSENFNKIGDTPYRRFWRRFQKPEVQPQRHHVTELPAARVDIRHTPDTVSITDSDGSVYVRGVPSESGKCWYTVDKNGDLIVVARFSREVQKPTFVIAPAEPSEDEKNFRKALDEFTDR